MNAEGLALKSFQDRWQGLFLYSTLGAVGQDKCLKNRLDAAFLAGLAEGRRICLQEIEDRMLAIVRGV